METLKLLSIALLLGAFSSCSNDDGNNASGNSGVMQYYISRSVTSYSDPGMPVHQSIFRRNIVNNKLFSFSTIDPVTFQEATFQDYHYTSDKLTSMGGGYSNEDYYYDAQGRFMASNFWDDTMQEYHRRIVYQPNNVVYVEMLTHAYDDPAAQILNRYITEFDANDNLIKAGPDANLDGIMDAVNVFHYTNNNLTSSEIQDGRTFTYSYSAVLNNFAVLDNNTYGKKMSRLLYANSYAGPYEMNLPQHSINLPLETVQSGNYEVLGNGLFKKSTVTSVFEGGQNLNVTEFFFY
jgi:hypothetical protein